ncbi:MAG: 3-dehydroquinate synthase [Candidatus Marinimicrobia bacterium]|nr:3-dehydroquinate synthase [Candidatus Neomarinimicrobiota bacterium]
MKVNYKNTESEIISTIKSIEKKYDKIFILSNSKIISHHSFINDLSDLIFICKDGESCKSIPQYIDAITFLNENNCNKKSCIIAVGGGTICDFAGFIASTYMRGIDLIMIPTSLLAMVDAAIGGKTALNFLDTRNLLGTFKDSNEIIIGLHFIQTLDDNERLNGMAEILKYSLILDVKLFNFIESKVIKYFPNLDLDIFKELIDKCIKNKLTIVNKDHYDKGIRNILNFGHTVGHALESYYDFKLSHGRAILYGMKVATHLSDLNKEEKKRIKNIWKIFNLPKLNSINKNEIMIHMENDKKNIGGQLNFILLDKLGNAIIKPNFNKKLIEEALDIL